MQAYSGAAFEYVINTIASSAQFVGRNTHAIYPRIFHPAFSAPLVVHLMVSCSRQC